VKLCKCKQPIAKGSKTRCKDCDAEYKWYYNQKKRFNLDKEDLDKMFVDQQGCCAICTHPFVNQRPAVDHCHITNKVRGLLCQKCNTAIGLLEDNITSLENAIKYLKNEPLSETSFP